MQTIIGAGGAIGTPLAKELTNYTNKIRLVSRNPRKVNETDDLFKGDISNKELTSRAIKGSDIVYLTVGLQYINKIWEEQWPKIFDNVIEGCKQHGAKLVFFDNVYPYGLVEGSMTEETPINPCSIKGEIRAKLDRKLMEEYAKKNLEGVIVRAADFYGPNVATSAFNMLVIDKMAKGKKANWIVNAKTIHSFTYTTDAAEAMALIGNTPDAYNQVWHAPTDPEKITGEQLIKIAAEFFNVQPKFTTLPAFMVCLAGIFDQTIKSTLEMNYQHKYDYHFDSSKYINRFKKEPTKYRDGIEAVVKVAKNLG
jgi:nucleoside-diphosphate-sugar epimerase